MQKQEYEILTLLTSVSEKYQRISMHGVRKELLEKQCKSIGLPLSQVQIPEMATMESYDKVMSKTLDDLKNQGATASVFGDIFLEDLRTYRESRLAEVNLKGIFPLWKLPTDKLIEEFIDLGFKTITTCVNEKYLDQSFVGRIIDRDFLKDLPKKVDPCGENGEFHTFVFDGPIFKEPILFEKGEIVYRKYEAPTKKETSDYDCEADETASPYDFGFWYCDLVPV